MISDYAWGIKHASAGVGYAALSGVSFGNAQRGLHPLGHWHFRHYGQRKLGPRMEVASASGWSSCCRMWGLLGSSEGRLLEALWDGSKGIDSSKFDKYCSCHLCNPP